MSTLVVGSGITGMAAALLLAQQGQQVTVLEAAPVVAPLLRGFSRDGLHFDTGFHCGAGLAERGVLRLWFGALGIWQFLQENALYAMEEQFRFAQGGNYFFPAQAQELPFAIQKQFGNATERIFSTLVQEMQRAVAYSPYTEPTIKQAPTLQWNNAQTLASKLASLALPQELRAMLGARCLLYGLSPEEASFQEYSLVGGMYFHSSHGIVGGGYAIRQAFLQAMQQQGIVLRTQAKVQQICHEHKQIRSVLLDSGEEIACDACIFTGHPAQLAHILPSGALRPAFFRHIQEMPETSAAFMLFAETQSKFLQHRALYLLPKAESGIILSPLGAENPSLYIVGGTAHKGRFPLVAIVPMHKGSMPDYEKQIEYTTWKQQQALYIKQYIEKNVPELGTVRLHTSATPATMQHWIKGSKGSLYGIAHKASSVPLLPVTRLKGLFLAGQNILLPGVLGGIISAALAVGFQCGHDAVLQRFRSWQSNV